MELEATLERANELLAGLAKSTSTPEQGRLDAEIDAPDLVQAVMILREAEWGYLAAITGLDLGGEPGEMETLYHFCEGAAVLTLRVRLPQTSAVLSSIDGLIPVASVYERELKEMYGIEFTDMSDPSRLFLPDDWQEGVYPMLKSFPATPQSSPTTPVSSFHNGNSQ